MSERICRVKIQSILTSVPSKPTGSGDPYKLTRIDHAMGNHTVHMIFYYEKNPFEWFDEHMFRMRESLMEALTLYPVVSGRLTRDDSGNWEVKCSDAGVRVLRARVGVTLDEWLRSADGNEERDLTVWDDMPDDPTLWAPFRIQINEFKGEGVAIGVSCSHMLADPTCLTLFFKSWTDIQRRKPVTYPPSFCPSALHPDSAPSYFSKSPSYLGHKSQAKTPSVKMATATFEFPNSIVKRSLSEIRGKCPDATPFDLLAALFWTRVVHLKGNENHHKDNETQSLSVCVDVRRLLTEPFPYGHFGNALHFSVLSVNGQEMESGGLEHVAELVHRHVSGLQEDEFWSAIQWLQSLKGEEGEYAPPFTMYGPELTCVNMEHMVAGDQSMIYSKNFNSIKPVHVACHVGNVEG